MFYSEKLKKNNEIQHGFFSRKNGVSKGIYESLNCGIGSNDKKENVEKNLEIVSKSFNIERKKLVLMNQTHSSKVEIIQNFYDQEKIKCDAMLSESSNIALCVLTADCAPILIYEKKKKIIGCIHAGWQGAFGGIIENSIKKLQEMGGNPKELSVSIGPCISKKSYEVKKDFYFKFLKKSEKYEAFFLKKDDNSFNFDLREFINKKFRDLGIIKIDNISVDSFASKNEYFSHRRAKKLGEDDYGRCISVIKKLNSQN